MQSAPAKKKYTPVRYFFFFITICIFVYTLTGFLFFPLGGTKMVEKKLSAYLHRKVHILSIRANPLFLSLDVRKFIIEHPASNNKNHPFPKDTKEFLSIDRLFLDLSPRTLLGRTISITSLQVTNPRIAVTRDANKNFLFEDMLSSPKSPDTSTSKVKKFSLNLKRFEIIDGQIDFLDDFKNYTFRFLPAQCILSQCRLQINQEQKILQLGSITTKRGNMFMEHRKNPQPENKTLTNHKTSGNKPSTKAAWQVSLDSIDMEGYEISWIDNLLPEPASIHLSNINLEMSTIDFTGTGTSNAEFSCNWNDEGSISLKGNFGLHPMKADIDVSLNEMELAPLSPYLEKQIQVRITRGNARTKAKVHLDITDPQKPAISCDGDLAISNFTSIDKILSKKILTWKNLDISCFHVDSHPFGLSIKTIGLDDFFSQIAISDQGIGNVKQLMLTNDKKNQPPSKPATSAVPQNAPVNISIDTIEFTKGKISFSDQYIFPHFQTDIQNLHGSIQGISPQAKSPGIIDIKGKYQNSANLAVSGTLKPFGQNFLADIGISLDGMELAALTPYSGKYIARTIDRGKLDMDLQYNITGTKLSSKNRLFLDQFALGSKVESKDAVSMPLDLALALLRD